MMNFNIETFPGIPQGLIDARKKAGPFYYDEQENPQHFEISEKIIKLTMVLYYYGELNKVRTTIGKGIYYDHN